MRVVICHPDTTPFIYIFFTGTILLSITPLASLCTYLT